MENGIVKIVIEFDTNLSADELKKLTDYEIISMFAQQTPCDMSSAKVERN